MGRKSRTTIKTHEVIVIKAPRKRMQAFCAECDGPATVISLDETIKLMRANSRVIHRCIEAGRLHIVDDQNGFPFICLTSLRQLMEFVDRAS